MGVFWNVAVFKKQHNVDVWEIVKEFAAGENVFFILLEECELCDCEGGSILSFNEYCYADDKFAKVLSQKLEGPVMVCSIYDDSFWDYYLYKNGMELDKFSTVPDCFEPIAKEEWDQWRGNAALLAKEFGCSAESLSKHLYFWKDEMGDAWEVVDFLEALGFKFPDFDDTTWEDSDDELESLNDSSRTVQEVYPSNQVCLYNDYFHDDYENFQKYLENKSKAKNPIDLVADVKVDMEFVVWVRVCEDGIMQQFSRNELTSEQIVQMMNETLNGRYTYFAADFLFQGKGIYVKRLKKKVYSPYHSTLVLHQGLGNFACLFFAGDSLCCYELIGNFYTYYYVDIKELQMLSVGNVMLPETIVFQERTGIDRALHMLFSHLKYADKHLKKSSLWSAQNVFPGGRNNYNRWRRELGLLED